MPVIPVNKVMDKKIRRRKRGLRRRKGIYKYFGRNNNTV
jgi:hypothetical protein